MAVPITPARAAEQPGTWRVLEAAGSARQQPPGDGLWWQVAAGDAIAGGSHLATDQSGWLVAASPDGRMSVGPNARLMLPAAQGLNRLWQDGGRLQYRSNPPPARALEVETPYASLRVTGSELEVAVDPGELLVEVQSGVVDVTTRDGTARAELRAGQAARVRAGQALTLEVRRGPGEAFEPVPSRPPATVATPNRFAAIGDHGSGDLYRQPGFSDRVPTPDRDGDDGSGAGGGSGDGDGSGSNGSGGGTTGGGATGGGSGGGGSGGGSTSGGSTGGGSTGGDSTGGSGTSGSDDRDDARSSGTGKGGQQAAGRSERRGGDDDRGRSDGGKGRDGKGGGGKGSGGKGGGKGGRDG